VSAPVDGGTSEYPSSSESIAARLRISGARLELKQTSALHHVTDRADSGVIYEHITCSIHGLLL
jgi:hypothetical protein